MGPPPAPFQIDARPGKVGQGIDVGKVGADDNGSGAEPGSPAETGTAQGRTGQCVAEGIYSSLASKSNWTFPCSAPETGQPLLAASAAWVKPA